MHGWLFLEKDKGSGQIVLCLTFDKNNNQKEGKREGGKVRVRSPDFTVIKRIKSTPPTLKCVLLGLTCPIQKVEVLPTYLAEGGKLNQILNQNYIDLKTIQ